MVTVVDAANLVANYSSGAFLKDCGEAASDTDERSIVSLLVEQIEFANVVVLNKTDLATPQEIATARSIIRSHNCKARIIETTQFQGRLALKSSIRGASASKPRIVIRPGSRKSTRAITSPRRRNTASRALSIRRENRSIRRSCTPSSTAAGPECFAPRASSGLRRVRNGSASYRRPAPSSATSQSAAGGMRYRERVGRRTRPRRAHRQGLAPCLGRSTSGAGLHRHSRHGQSGHHGRARRLLAKRTRLGSRRRSVLVEASRSVSRMAPASATDGSTGEIATSTRAAPSAASRIELSRASIMANLVSARN